MADEITSKVDWISELLLYEYFFREYYHFAGVGKMIRYPIAASFAGFFCSMTDSTPLVIVEVPFPITKNRNRISFCERIFSFSAKHFNSP